MASSHFFASESDGNLYRTDRPQWHSSAPVRVNYRRHRREIKTSADLLASLRAGEFAFPGGYRLYFITSDGAVLSFGAVRKNLRNVLESIKTNGDDGWRVVGIGNTADTDDEVVCDDTGEIINEGYNDADNE